MKTYLFAGYLSDHTIKALCWTLFQSLWIGLIVAALAGLIIIATKKSTAKLRYRLLCGLLMIFTGACTFTFVLEMSGVPNGAIVTTISSSAPMRVASISQALSNQISYTSLVNLLDKYSAWIVSVWLLCFAFKSIKLTSELLYIRKVKRRSITVTNLKWVNRVSAFSEKLGIRRVVTLLESEIIKVPVTIGYLKPVILVPAGMLLQMPPEQIDTILLHELAHILRRDYLINILQNIIETIFFFNPAIWWLSALIRQERENCCDDIVLDELPRKINYMEAMIAFQNLENSTGNYALGLALHRRQLINRLRRIVSRENQKLNTGEKIILLTGMALLCLFTFVPKANSKIRHSAVFLKQQVVMMLHRDNPAEPRIIEQHIKPAHTAATVFYAEREAGPLQIDTLLSFNSIKFRKTNADTANKEMDVTDTKGNRYYLKVVNNQLTALQINGNSIAEQKLNEYDWLHRQIDQAFRDAHNSKQSHAQARIRSDLQRDQDLISLNTKKKHHATTLISSGSTLPDKSGQLTIGKKRIDNQPIDSFILTQQRPEKHHRQPANVSTDRARVHGVINALVQENVVDNATDVNWFGLTEDELIVNGLKQSEALHQKLKDTYGIKPQFGLYYGPAQIYGSGVHMDKADL